jgi:hypothetical protein
MFSVSRILGVLICLCPPAQAAEIYWDDPLSETLYAPFPYFSMEGLIPQGHEFDFRASPHLHVEGEIVPGDAEKLADLLRAQLPDPNFDWSNNVIVSFNSNGGDFFTGLAMSDAIQGFAVGTYIGPDKTCLSSCAIAFLGGSAILLRNFPPAANRYIHVDGTLGFHAPFSSLRNIIQIPDGTPISAPIVNRLASQFYGQAQGAINELARRMERWEVSPDFVFNMLTRIATDNDDRSIDERFIVIDTYVEATQISATPVVGSIATPTEIGLMDADNACAFVWHFNSPELGTISGLSAKTAGYVNPDLIGEGTLSIDENHVWTYTPIPTSGRPEPVILTDRQSGFTYRHLVPASGPDSFWTEGLMRGRGRTQCNVYRAADGKWMVRTFNQDVHFDATLSPLPGVTVSDNRNRVLDFDKAHPINTYTRLSQGGSWRGLDVEVLFGYNAELSADFPDVTGPSFNCDGDLDPAAEVICKYPALARQDGIMGTLYGPAREIAGDAVRDEQRQWVAIRNRACRPDTIDRTDEFSEARLAECLFYFTAMRNFELKEISQ